MKGGFISIAGMCGIIIPIVMIITLALAISNSPSFSISANWFSDLAGTVGYEGPLSPRPNAGTATTAMIYNTGIILTGIISLIFAFGIWKSILTPSGRLGALALIISAIAVICLGVFPEPTGLPHSIAAFTCFAFGAIGIFYVGATVMETSKNGLGYVLFILGIIVLSGLTVQMKILELYTQMFFRATNQLIAMIAYWIFYIIFGFKMYQKAPKPILSGK